MKELKKYLVINSMFSGASGLVMLTFSDQLDNVLKILNPYVLPVIGVNLLIFALFVGYVSQKLLHQKNLIKIISLLDWLWVLGSIVIIVFQLFELSAAGYWVIGLTATWVGFLGFKQSQYNEQYKLD